LQNYNVKDFINIEAEAEVERFLTLALTFALA
jgi:hypothetical protein